VECYGDIAFVVTAHGQERSGTLRRVLYAHETEINLISICQFTALGTNANLKHFSGKNCGFTRDNEFEETDRSIGFFLYKIDIKAIVAPSPLKEEHVLVAKQSAASLLTWHRLSHVNCKTIQEMKLISCVVALSPAQKPTQNNRSWPAHRGRLWWSDTSAFLSNAPNYLAIKDKASNPQTFLSQEQGR